MNEREAQEAADTAKASARLATETAERSFKNAAVLGRYAKAARERGREEKAVALSEAAGACFDIALLAEEVARGYRRAEKAFRKAARSQERPPEEGVDPEAAAEGSRVARAALEDARRGDHGDLGQRVRPQGRPDG